VAGSNQQHSAHANSAAKKADPLTAGILTLGTVFNKSEIQALKERVGRRPFDERVTFKNDFCRCPFHAGDSDKSMHLVQRDGAWIATCFSGCNKSFDVISFVVEFDHVNFREAVSRLQGGKPAITSEAPACLMTPEEWTTTGRELRPDDIARFAASRKDKTAGFETFRQLGCRVIGDCLAFPHIWTDAEGSHFDLVKLRGLDEKKFEARNDIKANSFFNLDTVNLAEPVYIVEGEPDVAVMEEAGFRAVSVKSGSQKKFNVDRLAILALAPQIFLVGDQQRGSDPGQGCMDALQKALQDFGIGEKVFRVRFDDAHDMSELARITGSGFRERVLELRDDALSPWVRKNLPTISELSSEPVKWVIDRMLPYGGLSMLSATQGSMKSLTALFLAQAVAAGRNEFLGRKVMPRIPVLYIDRENPEGMISERARRMGILGNRDLIFWGDFNRHHPTPEPDDPRLLEFARQQNGLVIFDSLQDFYGDSSEIDNTAMMKLIARFRKLARAGAGVFVLHHFEKTGEKPRGGTTITALTDMSMKAHKRPDGVVELREDRFRMCGSWEIDFKCHFDAGAFHNFERHYQLEVLRDQTGEEVVRDAVQEKKAKAAKADADTSKVVEFVKMGLAPATIEGKTNISRSRAKKLAEKEGFFWDGEKWTPKEPDGVPY
jgi:hypothetical protein